MLVGGLVLQAAGLWFSCGWCLPAGGLVGLLVGMARAQPVPVRVWAASGWRWVPGSLAGGPWGPRV